MDDEQQIIISSTIFYFVLIYILCKLLNKIIFPSPKETTFSMKVTRNNFF